VSSNRIAVSQHAYKSAYVNALSAEKLFGRYIQIGSRKSRESLVTSEDDLGDVDFLYPETI
jgi:hypothetical protein